MADHNPTASPKPATGDDLAQVPADLDQTFSSVRQTESSLLQAAAQIGVTDSFTKSPKQLVADFYKRWFDSLAASHPRVILTHGEDTARDALHGIIAQRYGIDAERPGLYEVIEL